MPPEPTVRQALENTPPRSTSTLPDEFDTLFCGLWPGRLRDLIDPLDPKPLAIGIHAAIADALGMEVDERKRLGVLLRKWTGRVSYLRALRNPGAMRHDLEAQPVEPVSPADALDARHRLYQSWLKLQRKKAGRPCNG